MRILTRTTSTAGSRNTPMRKTRLPLPGLSVSQNEPAEQPAATCMPEDVPAGLLPDHERVELLGRGGMGEVYSAFDPQLKRLVAAKVIRGPLTPEVLARFRTEAE